MAGRGVRRAAAVVVLLAVLTGVGLFVGVWLLGDGGGDDEDAPSDGTTTTRAETTTTAIDSVEALADAIGCDDTVPEFDGALPLPDIVESGLCHMDGQSVAGLHLAADDEAMAGLLAYFDDFSGDWLPNGCPGETPEQTEARGRYAIVAGERWIVTSHFASARDAAIAAGGEEVAFSPESVPPASYFIAWPPCDEPPQIEPA